ncbi:ornithine cyclodeaminase family protein [Actinomadura flavalba]|uniref:ornithine cyclodeaminase family protein n=1 Tax=Actinomadura flavalba TaxID=1120938 RepID=UPI00039EBB83|nr:ornithine cyclodeaminase family protein [Actinomadura flavalba]
MTILLNRSALTALLDVPACLDALRAGFVAAPAGTDARRIIAPLPGPGTATALIPGLLPGVPAYTVKVNAKFPDARPALRGVVCLHDLATGELLALLDSATVTAWRTGLAAALGTHALAPPEAGRVAVIGAGAQADLVLRGLAALRTVTALTVCDLDAGRAETFADRHGVALNVPAVTAPDPRAAAGRADIVVTATWARTPLLDAVAPGTHVTALGADEPGKSELAPGRPCTRPSGCPGRTSRSRGSRTAAPVPTPRRSPFSPDPWPFAADKTGRGSTSRLTSANGRNPWRTSPWSR